MAHTRSRRYCALLCTSSIDRPGRQCRRPAPRRRKRPRVAALPTIACAWRWKDGAGAFGSAPPTASRGCVIRLSSDSVGHERHRDRKIAGAPAELAEPGVRAGRRAAAGCTCVMQQFVLGERGGHDAGEEIFGGDHPGAACALRHHLGIESAAATSAPFGCRVRIGEAAAEGAAVADRIMRDVAHDVAEQLAERSVLDLALERHVTHASADDELAAVDGDAIERRDAVDVDQMRGPAARGGTPWSVPGSARPPARGRPAGRVPRAGRRLRQSWSGRGGGTRQASWRETIAYRGEVAIGSPLGGASRRLGRALAGPNASIAGNVGSRSRSTHPTVHVVAITSRSGSRLPSSRCRPVSHRPRPRASAGRRRRPA